MKGDFSRVSFDPRHHFSQVLMQQGRVTLDADPNEQGSILLHYMRTLARDLFGPYAAPADHAGFGLTIVDEDGTPALNIGAGRYYVQGVLCESEGCDYIDQPHFIARPGDENDGGDPLRRWLTAPNRGDGRFWIYLKVWERHVTSVEMPRLRDVALGGPDTCARAQVVWQVRALALDEVENTLEERLKSLEQRLNDSQDDEESARLQALIEDLTQRISLLRQDFRQACAVPLDVFERRQLPEMAARLQPVDRVDDPCITPPDSAYRGAENHLYRVEIHRGNQDGGTATFKWSRDNGSVVTRWISGSGSRLEVANARDFRDASWVELSDEQDDLLGRPGPLRRIASIEDNVIVLTAEQNLHASETSLVRRWDQTANGDVQLDDGAVQIIETSDSDAGWIALEDGIQVRFLPGAEYRTGDYWLIAARTASGIDWPRDSKQALHQPPHGVDYHYAPLGFLGLSASGEPTVENTCRCVVHPASTCGLLRDQGDPIDADRTSGISDRIVASNKTPATPATKKAITKKANRKTGRTT